LLIQFIQQHRHIKQMVLMFQKEVAQRIVATPGSKNYGRLSIITKTLECRLSIITQAFFKPTIVYHLAPSVFTPPPKVDSAVVHFAPLPGPHHIPIKQLEYVTHIFFSSRRKTIGHIIKNYLADNAAAQEILRPYVHLRPENLAMNIYIQVALTIKN
jgi:16S rRNA (adenine1518-N6/adenine1519-N6)-dimethyltransferase